MQSLRVIQYSAQWKQEFEQTRSSVLWATEGLVCDVAHIGSTSIPDAIAAPTIDVLAGMTSLVDLNEAASCIQGLNFKRLVPPAWCDDELVGHFQKFRSGFATHRVLLVRHGGAVWKQGLQVRNWLIDQPYEFEALMILKREYFGAAASLQDYEHAKERFFQALCSRLS